MAFGRTALTFGKLGRIGAASPAPAAGDAPQTSQPAPPTHEGDGKKTDVPLVPDDTLPERSPRGATAG